jgi:ABC-type branched-subunit amino acid transport system substrate-binding protein
MSRTPLKALAALAAIALLAGACSSSSASSTSTTIKTTGTPIPVGQILPITGGNLALPEYAQSLAASVTALNDEGGINGHPLKLVQCDSQGVASTEVGCAQEMVSDHVVATLEDQTFAAPAQVNTILGGAGIPRIGLTELDTTDYQSLSNFDYTGGAVFILAGMLEDLVHKGDKKISMVIPDVSTAGQMHLLLDPIAASMGAQVVNYVLVSSASGDYSQYVAQAEENGAQGAVLALGTSQMFEVAQAINQLRPKLNFALGNSDLSLNQLKELGHFALSANYAWWTPSIDDVSDFPGLKEPLNQLLANMRGQTVKTISTVSLMSWLTVHAFSEVMKAQPGTPTATSTLAAFKAAKDIPMNGLIKPWTPTDYQNAGTFDSLFKNVSNPWMYPITYDGTGTHTSPAKVFNTFAGLPGTS